MKIEFGKSLKIKIIVLQKDIFVVVVALNRGMAFRNKLKRKYLYEEIRRKIYTKLILEKFDRKHEK